MTNCEKYNIPREVISLYESIIQKHGGRNGADIIDPDSYFYDDGDLDRLSLMVTLKDSGFSEDEIRYYMEIFLGKDPKGEARLRMLGKKRRQVLDEIHFREKQLESIDYLRYQMRKG